MAAMVLCECECGGWVILSSGNDVVDVWSLYRGIKVE